MRPEEFRAFMAYHDALMDKEGRLARAGREMMVVATSAAHRCLRPNGAFYALGRG